MGRTRQQQIFADTTNIAALSNVVSPAWIDIGKRAPMLDVIRSNTGGTYVLEIDWSIDASAVLTTDTITTVAGQFAQITSKARYAKVRVKNTHATVAFSAHSTVVARDAATGVV